MTKANNHLISWFLWPLKALWDLLTWMLGLSGRLVAGVIGLAFMIIGLVLTVIVLTAPLGIPLMIFGFLLMLRGIF